MSSNARVPPFSSVSTMCTCASAVPCPRASLAFACIVAVRAALVAFGDLDLAAVGHRDRADAHLDPDPVRVRIHPLEHFGARHAGRDALDVKQRREHLVGGRLHRERVFELHLIETPFGPDVGAAGDILTAGPRSIARALGVWPAGMSPLPSASPHANPAVMRRKAGEFAFPRRDLPETAR